MQRLIPTQTSSGLWSNHQQSAQSEVVSYKHSALLEDHSSQGEEVLMSSATRVNKYSLKTSTVVLIEGSKKGKFKLLCQRDSGLH